MPGNIRRHRKGAHKSMAEKLIRSKFGANLLQRDLEGPAGAPVPDAVLQLVDALA